MIPFNLPEYPENRGIESSFSELFKVFSPGKTENKGCVQNPDKVFNEQESITWYFCVVPLSPEGRTVSTFAFLVSLP